MQDHYGWPAQPTHYSFQSCKCVMSAQCFKNNNRDDVILTLKSISGLAWACFRLYWPSNHAALWQLHCLRQSFVSECELLLCFQRKVSLYTITTKVITFSRKHSKNRWSFKWFRVFLNNKIIFQWAFKTPCWGMWGLCILGGVNEVCFPLFPIGSVTQASWIYFFSIKS